ncbi:MAG: DUF3034 family protein [Planctomycetes bacterium]|nr:DUF3034 family protein [Planctomycetota bacterium]
MNAAKKPLIGGALGLCLIAAIAIASLTYTSSPPAGQAGQPQAASITSESTGASASQADPPAQAPAETPETIQPTMTPVDEASDEQTIKPVTPAAETAKSTADQATETDVAQGDAEAAEAETTDDAAAPAADATDVTASNDTATTPEADAGKQPAETNDGAAQADHPSEPVAVDLAAIEAEAIEIETTDDAPAPADDATDVAASGDTTTPEADAAKQPAETTDDAARGAAAARVFSADVKMQDDQTTDGEASADLAAADEASPELVTMDETSIPAAQAGEAGDGDELARKEPDWVRRWSVLADEFDARKAANDTPPAMQAETAEASTTMSQTPVMANMEGTGGGLLTPSAYLLNPGPADKPFGMPTVGSRFLRFGSKDLATLTIGETFYGRVEVSYAVQHFGLGGFHDAVEKRLGRDIVRDNAWLHTWSLRGLLIEEDRFGPWTPAVTAGVSFKYNNSIQTIDRRTGHALGGIGLEKSNGVDWTLTTTKTICEPWLNRPLSLTAGMRLSNGAHRGLMGFDNSCHMIVEGGIKYFPTDWLAVGYEFRDQADPYDQIPGLYGDEDDAHAITADLRVTETLTVSTGWIMMGHVANGSADCGWTLGMQWDF